MNKILRYSLIMLLAFIGTVSYAQTTVTFVAGTDKGADNGTAAQTVTLTKDGITLTAVQGESATNGGGIFGRTDHYRIYKASVLTVSSSVGKITQVVFTCTASGKVNYGSGNFTNATSGAYSFSEKIGTWEGNADSFSLTASEGQVRATKIEVTYIPSGVSVTAPAISGETPFTDKTSVSISVPEGTKVYYTTDGSEPTDKGTEYTAPFEITETTTVKAVAYKGSDKSSVASKEFVKTVTTATEDFAAFKALTVGTNTVQTFKDAQVVYTWTSKSNNTSIYVRDASGALLLYNRSSDAMKYGFKTGDVLNGTINLTSAVYNKSIQAAVNDNTNTDNITITDGSAPQPKVITYADAKENVSDLVLLENVDIVEDNGKFYIGTGDDRIQVYNGFYIEDYTVAAATGVNVKGIIVRYNDQYQIQPIEVPSTSTGIGSVNAATSNANAPIYNLAGQRVGNDYKGVVIQNGKKRINK